MIKYEVSFFHGKRVIKPIFLMDDELKKYFTNQNLNLFCKLYGYSFTTSKFRDFLIKQYNFTTSTDEILYLFFNPLVKDRQLTKEKIQNVWHFQVKRDSGLWCTLESMCCCS